MKTNAQSIIKTAAAVTCIFLIVTSFLPAATSSSSVITENESVFAVYDGENHQISVEYLFETPFIDKTKLGDTWYNQVTMKDCPNYYSNLGEPLLPVKGVKLLLPFGEDVSSINVVPGKERRLEIDLYIVPAAELVPLSQFSSAPLPVKNKTIYNSNELFPKNLFTEVGTYCSKGYRTLFLRLSPVRYNPVEKELICYESMTVYVSTTKSSDTSPLFRGLEGDKLKIEKEVDNPAVADTYMIKPKRVTEDYDLLIITTDGLKNGFEPLKNAHNADGINTTIKTLTDIGSNNPGDIRDYIRDAYLNWSIDYVLIGGDHDIVPARKLFLGKDPFQGYNVNAPSDLYYACLDGPYNYDGDNLWGERYDGENGGDVDLIAEVFVGRACVSNETEVSNFVMKTLAYKETCDSYLLDVKMVGELLWEGAPWGGDYMDELINGSSANGYTTVGIPYDEYNIYKLYDRDWPGNDWPKSEIIGHINNGAHIINHLGHSGYDHNMRMTIGDVDNLTNDKYCFVYSQGCRSGGFDNPKGYDCIAEHFTVKTEHGAFAGIWNARYGWASMSSTHGPSQRFHRQFWDVVFDNGKTVISEANQRSKEVHIGYINFPYMRWCYYELNFFGDPTLEFIPPPPNNPPETPSQPSGPFGPKWTWKWYTFTTNTIDPDGDQVQYGWDWNNDSVVDKWTEFYDSGETANANKLWIFPDTYYIKVKAKDINGAESAWSESLKARVFEGPSKQGILGPSPP